MAADKKGERKLEGHRGRLREKYLNHGLEKLTDDEIVEMLLTLATPRRDCKQIAREALDSFGGLAPVLEASVEELQKIKGIGATNAMGITMVQQIARKFLREKIIRGDYLRSFGEALEYFTHAMKASGRETLHVLYLSSQNAILGEERFTTGAPGSVEVHPRQVVETAFKLSSASVVMAHNHPGGDVKPSPDDIRATRNLCYALKFMDLSLRDHLIITADGHYSFMKEGLMAAFENEYEALSRKIWK
ncbi:MAG: DNA repair protein RadC [Nitrospinota bacterium]|nr:DNA repair protein RadC [Nitrospinota bacterium]